MGLYSCRVCIVTVDDSAATMSYVSSLLPTAKARYLKKLQLVGGYLLVHTNYHHKLGWMMLHDGRSRVS